MGNIFFITTLQSHFELPATVAYMSYLHILLCCLDLRVTENIVLKSMHLLYFLQVTVFLKDANSHWVIMVDSVLSLVVLKNGL